MPLRTYAKIYTDVNTKKPREYWDYGNFEIQWGDDDKYQLLRRIGKGKYSDVFEGTDIVEKKTCAIKILKPVKKKKIKREIKILQNLSNGVNIIKLLGFVLYTPTKTPTLIFEYLSNTDFKQLLSFFTERDIQYYLYELLKALDYTHSMGIIHRDLKPNNILYNHDTKQLRLVDWGLAEFYHPGNEMNVRVASRYYKAPELLVDFQTYDYSLDMWSLGCIVGSFIFKKNPMFHGQNNNNQLLHIIKILGTEKFQSYLNKYEIHLNPELTRLIKRHSTKKWERFVNDGNKHLVSAESIDFLDKLLQYDHANRLTSQEALNHHYLKSVATQQAISSSEVQVSVTEQSSPTTS